MEPLDQFAANLRRLRKDAGLTQEELSTRSGLHFTEISRLENTRRDVRLLTIVQLARGLEIRAADLLADIG